MTADIIAWLRSAEGEAWSRERARYQPTSTRDCQQECDADCEIGPVHCWNRHRPSHKPDWHDGAACDAAAGTQGAA